MPVGQAYLCAVMDWHTRLVLGWAVSNTMDTGLCLSALRQALDSTGVVPGIFHTDQGSQFTSVEWTGVLLEQGIRISMDGIGRWMDNGFIERLCGLGTPLRYAPGRATPSVTASQNRPLLPPMLDRRSG